MISKVSETVIVRKVKTEIMKKITKGINLLAIIFCLYFITSCSSSKNMAMEKETLLNNWILQTKDGKDQTGCNVKKPLNITFSEKGVNGYSGCNTYFGPFKIGKKHHLKLGPLASTMMACVGEDCGRVEVGFIRNLDLVNKYKIENDHLYFYQDNQLLLTFRKAD